MNPPKAVFDLSPSYLERRPFWCIQIKTEEVEDIDARKSISPEAKWTWLRLKVLFHRMEFKGVLSENGAPIPIETLAKMLRRRPSSVKVLDREIKELVAEGVLKRHAGFIFDPAVMAATMDQLRRISGKYFRTFEEVLERFPQVLESFGEVLGKFWEKSENEMSAQADASNLFSEGESEEDLEKVRNSNVRNSSSRTSTTKRSTGTGSTINSPNLPAVAGISAEELAKVKAKYKHLPDIDAAIQKWHAKSIERGWPVTLEKLRKFLATEKQQPAKAVAGKKMDAASFLDAHEAEIRQLPGIEGRSGEDSERQLIDWLQRTFQKNPKFAKELLDADIWEFFGFPVPDKYETKPDFDTFTFAGLENCTKDERGVTRLLGSKWLVSDAYAAADAERREREAQRQREKQKHEERQHQLEEEREAARRAHEEKAKKREQRLDEEAVKLEYMPEAWDSESYSDAIWGVLGCSQEFSKEELLERAASLDLLMESDGSGARCGRKYGQQAAAA